MVEPLKVKKKGFFDSPYWPAFLSGVIAPGLGQITNRNYAKGFFLLFASLGGSYWFIHHVQNQLKTILPGTPETWAQNESAFQNAYLQLAKQYPDIFLTFYALMLIVWIFGIVDAFMTAKEGRKTPRANLDDRPIN